MHFYCVQLWFSHRMKPLSRNLSYNLFFKDHVVHIMSAYFRAGLSHVHTLLLYLKCSFPESLKKPL